MSQKGRKTMSTSELQKVIATAKARATSSYWEAVRETYWEAERYGDIRNRDERGLLASFYQVPEEDIRELRVVDGIALEAYFEKNAPDTLRKDFVEAEEIPIEIQMLEYERPQQPPQKTAKERPENGNTLSA